jgi:hypothetical protein
MNRNPADRAALGSKAIAIGVTALLSLVNFAAPAQALPAEALADAATTTFPAPSNDSQTKAATEGSTVPYRYPPLDPATALTGAALLAALKKGGFVLYMRHTQAGTVTPECAQSNLSPAGERDARFVGEAIKTLRIPIGRVVSSPVCRVLDTAKLMGLGKPQVSNDLSNVPSPAGFDFDSARGKRIAEMPARATNTLLVSHAQGGKLESQWMYLDYGEMIVYRPGGKNRSEALARIRADHWYDLMALENK